MNATATSPPALVGPLKALADPTRLRMLELLAGGERCVCDLQAPLGIAQNLASHHLRVLREAGLVRVRRDSRWAYYSLERSRLQEVAAAVEALAAPPAADAAPAACCEPA